MNVLRLPERVTTIHQYSMKFAVLSKRSERLQSLEYSTTERITVVALMSPNAAVRSACRNASQLETALQCSMCNRVESKCVLT